MGQARLLVSPALLVDLFKNGQQQYTYRVLRDGLPDDARIVDVHWLMTHDRDLDQIVAIVESATFPEVPPDTAMPLLPPPVIEATFRPDLVALGIKDQG